MKNTQLLPINDMCGYGKVALSAMLPVLSHMGYRIHTCRRHFCVRYAQLSQVLHP